MRDLRYACRVLLKSPAFTVTAVLTLGLCIGANTAIYTVVDRVLLRPLPYPHPERLAMVVREYRGNGVGKAIALRGEPYTIVGVMPASLPEPTPVDVWTPVRPSLRGEGGGENYTIIARVKDGVAWPEADAMVAASTDAVVRDRYKKDVG